jgi:hypothetical protein
MMENPWHRLPDKAPYVLPEDEGDILAFHKKAHQHYKPDLDLIPEAFVGRPDAPVVILGNNPGVKGLETKAYRQKPAFANRMRDNLLHRLPDDFPFLELDPNLDIPLASRSWWERKLKHLVKDFGGKQLARSILAVEFFPYVSHKYGWGKIVLPSQQYSFSLVRSAVARRAVIVVTRGQPRWLRAVKELDGYSRLILLKEVQRAPISPRNCPDEQYQEIVRAIKATLPPG